MAEHLAILNGKPGLS